MSYVIYHKETSRIFEVCKRGRLYGKQFYETESAVKAAMTREVKKGSITREEYDYAESGFYKDNIEQTRRVRNMMSGIEVEQSVNTPLCLDVSSETYWSM